MLKGYIEKINDTEFYAHFECWGYGQMSIDEALKFEGVDLIKDVNSLKIGESKYYSF